MYALAITLILASLAAVYATLDNGAASALPPPQAAQALADNLAIYRQAALDYARLHPGTRGAVSVKQLPFPSWYPGPNSLWRNYIAGGTVVTYAAAQPPLNISGEIAALADGSLLAGVAYRGAVVRAGYARSDLPSNGVPLPAGLKIANGLPVWMGQAY
ncbi:pilus assembly protein PilM [Burkholderia ubonensis]|uniref:Pilus assembly protein PilM n=1 Tax=Burkholderia ubonensis TaxID=101571 RepID=A0AAW3N423_9BURK|nr:type IV pilus biogenesis protein PilM [Burkholderia ubonensis]KVQ02902.1 pilus assembly protein PilM [Burkholderia ubonensis]KWA02702.1 pilus assembly protein PilM [Burkholderia ubonensis]KWD58861.1 pilus assembly protein PilM [Burkholderia ubonensis]KWD62899.1 pilus assembly protein PilM [Burkholderia ubonensis]